MPEQDNAYRRFWQRLLGIPVESRHEDWCHTVTGCTEQNHCTCENGEGSE